jgi:hypothetical protein
MANDQNAIDAGLAVEVLHTVVRHFLMHGYLGAVEISSSNVDQIAEGLATLMVEMDDLAIPKVCWMTPWLRAKTNDTR